MSENKYKKLTQREHILKRSETYVGSKTTEKANMYVIRDNDLNNIVVERKDVQHNPAFIKMFDEILTNASDQSIRTGKVGMIKILIDDKKISIENDGPTIPIEMHPTEKVYNAELIFSHLLTGENYDDTEERVVGGRNGLGAKLVNVFSRKFVVECCDGKKRFKQYTKNNMKDIEEPEIIDVSSDTKSYTKVTFYPDYSKFDFDKLTEDLKSIMYKRCLDIAAYIPNVRISLDGKTLPVKKMSDYMKMHLPEDAEFFYEKLDNDWEIGLAQTTGHGFEQVSIVNGITTHRGGTHVNHISLGLSKQISDKIRKKNVTWVDVKNKLFIFLISKVPNPIFDTQTKEYLSTRMSVEVHKNAEVKESTIRRIIKSEIVQSILDEVELKEKLSLKRMGSGKKSKVKMEKLVDANKAGTMDSESCYLFLCEGDSAVSMAVSGMSVVGRDYYGAFPLKGKVLNVRGTSTAKIKANTEITNLIEIMGLQFGEKYEDTSNLRYGKCVIMTDADVDGIHIKGLLMNLFETFWPELLKMDFLYEFITPILKAKKGKDVKAFYTSRAYDSWLQTGPKGYTIKYYKGLGTSTPAEGKEYFKDIDKHLLPFTWDTEDNTDIIDKVFNDKRVEDRKNWILNTKPQEVEKYETPTPISSFIDNEMITFSLYDNVRSIPDIYDGLKPSQRKILYTCLSEKVKKDFPVSSLGGLVKSKSKYHHGESSLEQGIIGMAQDYIGSNNLNLLVPSGGFGTRLQGGKDAASARYINTFLSNWTEDIFKQDDNDILNFLEEDGFSIEPETYKPIIPMVLVNGVEGIGSGWSTGVPQYDVSDIIRVIENKLNDKRSNKIHPKYNTFKGTITEDDETGHYKVRGIFNRINTNYFQITELPVGTWTQNYITYLNKLQDNKYIKGFQDNSTEEMVDIKINMNREDLEKLSNDADLMKKFKLQSNIYMTNMNLFVDGKIQKFKSAMDIIDVYFDKRIKDYADRKKAMIQNLINANNKLDNTVRFIQLVTSDKIKINNRKKIEIEQDLISNNIDKIEDSYNYLLGMAIYSLSKEKVEELLKQQKIKIAELNKLKKTSPEQLWLDDLEILKSKL